MDLQTQKSFLATVKGPVVQGIVQLMNCERIICRLLGQNILNPDFWKEEMHPQVNIARKIAADILDQLRKLQFAMDDICSESSKKLLNSI